MQDTIPARNGIPSSGTSIDVDCFGCGHTFQASALGTAQCPRCRAAGKKLRSRFASRLFSDRDGRPLRVRDLYAAGQELHLMCSRCRPTHQVRFGTVRDVERQLGMIDPLLSEACQRLVCPTSGQHGFVGVAAAPQADRQMHLPFFR